MEWGVEIGSSDAINRPWGQPDVVVVAKVDERALAVRRRQVDLHSRGFDIVTHTCNNSADNPHPRVPKQTCGTGVWALAKLGERA